MIKRNKCLIHLDLSLTGLTEYMLWHISKSLSRARSVVSCHLSGNIGITNTLIEQIHGRIRCKPKFLHRPIGLEVGLNQADKALRTQRGRFKGYDEKLI